ncbi:cyclic nucleotide-binding protein [Diplonema papillatum]|nr:cyclic nucleotide-binding protein [Diplonema papillatum]
MVTPPAASPDCERDTVLDGMLPFNLLSKPKRAALAKQLELVEVEPGGVLLRRGEPSPGVFFVHSGVFVFVDSHGRVQNDTQITCGRFFGEQSVLLGNANPVEIRAAQGADSSRAFMLPSAALLHLLGQHTDNTRFALAVASDLRFKQGIFDAFLTFRATVQSAIHAPGNRVDFPTIIEKYKALRPAIHSLIDDPVKIDYTGWSYAARRLPDNITSVYSLVLSRTVINVLKVRDNSVVVPVCTTFEDGSPCDATDGGLDFVVSALSPGKRISTAERRRTCWEVMPGKLFVLLRELQSDFLDFMTNLCLHSIETRKLRHRLRPVGLILPLLQATSKEIQRLKAAPQPNLKEAVKAETAALSNIRSLTPVDVEGLQKLWPGANAVDRIIESLIHHGDYQVYLDSSSTTEASGDERWMERVRTAAIQLIGQFDFEPCSTDLMVDIVSSNTHSVLNCLSPYVHGNKQAILDWSKGLADQNQFEGLSEMDRLYAATKMYLEAHKGEAKKKREVEAAGGIAEVQEREVTGVSVQLMDLNRLKAAAKGFDTVLGEKSNRQYGHGRHLLVNIDYCFGSQANHIMRLLCLIFGKCIRSVNILGKAGGLVGNRGDILFPTHLVNEATQGTIRAVDNSDIDPVHLREMSNRCVHVGPIITIEGTLLQNRELLLFYERLLHTTGLEMEAWDYNEAVTTASLLGIIDAARVRTRFLYYVSDLPLQAAQNSSLSQKMTLKEGIPALYSIMRCLLFRVLDVSAEKPPSLKPCETPPASPLPSSSPSAPVSPDHVTKGPADLRRWQKLRTIVRWTLGGGPAKALLKAAAAAATPEEASAPKRIADGQ